MANNSGCFPKKDHPNLILSNIGEKQYQAVGNLG